MGERRPYLNDRLIEDHPDGFVIIVPAGAVPTVPLACELCDHLMRSNDDETSFYGFGCCDRCARLWAHPRREAWKDGWRPSREQVIAAEDDRLPLSITFDVD